MARLRKFCAYQGLKRPYTRVSKYKKNSFTKARPHSVLVKFEMGEPARTFDLNYHLIAEQDGHIRHNALESARQTSNRALEKEFGKKGYFLRIRKYPFHILRENPMATGAGADRMSQGMSQAFGKPISSAARVKKGDVVFEVRIPRAHSKVAKLALSRAAKKLPGSYRIILNAPKVVAAKKEVAQQ